MAHTEKISLKVNVDKIDKASLYKGEKGTYLTLTIVPTPSNQWNDYLVSQYMGKGVDDIILGNGRDLNFNQGDSGSSQSSGSAGGPAMPSSMDSENLPF